MRAGELQLHTTAMATSAMQLPLLAVVLCVLLTATTGVAGAKSFVPAVLKAKWEAAICGKDDVLQVRAAAINDGATAASTDKELAVRTTADTTPGAKYLVGLIPGVGCVLFWVGWDGNQIAGTIPILVGISQTVTVSLYSAYVCKFKKSDAVPLPPTSPAALAGAAFPTSFAAVKPQVRCSFFLYNTTTDLPVNGSNPSEGYYGPLIW